MITRWSQVCPHSLDTPALHPRSSLVDGYTTSLPWSWDLKFTLPHLNKQKARHGSSVLASWQSLHCTWWIQRWKIFSSLKELALKWRETQASKQADTQGSNGWMNDSARVIFKEENSESVRRAGRIRLNEDLKKRQQFWKWPEASSKKNEMVGEVFSKK